MLECLSITPFDSPPLSEENVMYGCAVTRDISFFCRFHVGLTVPFVAFENIVVQSVLVAWEFVEAEEVNYAQDCSDRRYRHGG